MSVSSYRRIVIGDVHGHYEGLMRLLDAIAPASNDQVYFLGDLIDRGPQSAQVVDFVKDTPYQCLLGNHEQMLLNVLTKRIPTPTVQAWLYSGGQATVSSYEEATIPHDHLEWFDNLPTYIDLGDIWLVHAGVNPFIPLEAQTADQLCWVRDEFHSIQKPYFADKLMIIGHTITFTLPGVSPGQLAQGEGWLDIDTGAYHPRSGWLTGLDITNNLVYQANVLKNCIRISPLEEIVTTVKPEQFHINRRNKCLA
ncbi:serine/threonine protein phosphatase [Mastigocladus laminosus UU774]|nr:serine/threonine protein phosphatase [Westiellopsis prolifica IICB1]TFI52063.1 serine/threonine protein phosphatase [Mastigocladus laminosus UU774]